MKLVLGSFKKREYRLVFASMYGRGPRGLLDLRKLDQAFNLTAPELCLISPVAGHLFVIHAIFLSRTLHFI